MKTFKFFLAALCLTFLFSCSKDDDAPQDVNTSGMLGEWNLQNFEYEGTTKMVIGETSYTMNYTGATTESDVIIDFKENGSYSAHGGYTILFTMEGMDYEVPIEMNSSTGNWSIAGNKMILSEGLVTLNTGEEMASKPTEAIIDEISPSRIVLLFTHEETITESGYENEVNVTGRYILVR
jgi:hypothetical protein